MNIVELIETVSVLGVVVALGIIGLVEWIRHLKEEEQKSKGEYQSGNLVDGTWTCKECGAFNAKYLKRCGKCYNPKIDILDGRTKEWMD